VGWSLKALLSALALGSAFGVANAADLTARQVTLALFEAVTGHAPDLSGKDLSNLDL
jgi:isocitrate/isopropylmalate dehydrogenase